MCGNWETEYYNSVWKLYEAANIHFWECINGNQAFILDSHRPFIFTVGALSGHYCFMLRKMAAHRKPLAAHREPLAAHREPLAAHRKPLAAHREPLAAHREPLFTP